MNGDLTQYENIIKMWRKEPVSQGEATILYNNEKRKITENMNLEEIKLPVLPKTCFEPIKNSEVESPFNKS